MNIKKIMINEKEYNFDNDLIYVFGKNNSGKTYLFNIIDLIFGASESLKNIMDDKNIRLERINCIINNEKNDIELTININEEGSKSYLINDKTTSFVDYKKFIDELFFKNMDFSEISNKLNFTYRQACVINFFPEIHIGDLYNIFPKDTKKYRKTTQVEDAINILLGVKSPDDINKEHYNRIRKFDDDRKEKINKKIKKIEKDLKTNNIDEFKDEIDEYVRLSTEIKMLSTGGRKIERQKEILNKMQDTIIHEEDKQKIRTILNRIEYKLQIEKEINQRIKNNIDKIHEFEETKIEKKIELNKLNEELRELEKNKKHEVKINYEIRTQLEKTFNSYTKELKEYINVGDNLIDVDYEDFTINYNGGSLAIKTMLQLIMIFSIHDVLNSNNRNHIPLIVLDAYSQPFDLEDNKYFISDLISVFKKVNYNKNTQIILLDSKPEDQLLREKQRDEYKIIKISDGLI